MLDSQELAARSSHPLAQSVTDELSLYREIFERSVDGIAVLDPNGIYLHQNAAHAALTGYTLDDLRGRTPAIHVGDERFAEILHALTTNGRFIGEVESRSKAGDERVLEVS